MGRYRKRKNETKTNERGSWGTKFDNIVKENPIFEGYYKAQKIVPEEEWESFIGHLKEPLPASFRITPYRSQAKVVLKTIQSEYFKDLTAEEMQPTCLSWYPDNMAWQLKLSKRDIRKSEVNVKLHNFLVSETDAGSISRQETVSMIPPIVLDVKPHHKVLDMCAAPGSKTTQLVEMLHTDESRIPEGVVVANDANNKRCYMLVHQLKRLQSPCVLITNHDASTMPNIRIPTSDGEAILKFDRILCDVPCSGDGTMRKNLDIWMKWNTANGCNLHGLQFRIARRGLEMLAIDGQMVYSTCSLNPIEDEAVIHRLLVEAKGSIELVDVSDRLPGLKYCQGLSHWVITDRELNVYESPQGIPDAHKNLLRASIFPPKAEDAAQLHLQRCVRVLPHQQNTGGFFVAVLKKTKPLPWESAAKSAYVKPETKVETDVTEEANKATDDNSGRRSPLRKRRRGNVFKEDPFVFFDENEPVWPPIREFFGVSTSLDSTLLLTRSKEGKKKNIYVVNPLVRDITRTNEGHVQIINTGVKMFSRSDNKGPEQKCDFRITEEGAPILMKYMSKRRVVVNRDDLVILLLNDLSETAPELTRFSDKAVEQLKEIETGSMLLEFYDDSLSIVLVGWKGDFSVRAFVPKNDRVHHLRMVGADYSKFVVNKFKEAEKLKAQAEDVEAAVEESENEDAPEDHEEEDESIKTEDATD